jgi:hypothetical protein
MSNRLVRAVLALYPRSFRRRYGREVRELVEELEGAGDQSRLRLVGGLLAAAAAEWLRATRAAAALSIIALLAVAASAAILAVPSASPAHHLSAVTAVSGEVTTVMSAPPGLVPPAPPSR